MLFTLFTTLFCLALGNPTSARDCTACVRVENMTITVSTDGSALGNPNGPMGWAWADHEQNAGGKPGHKHDDHGYDAGGATNGTNQIGELCAVLEALRAHPGPHRIGFAVRHQLLDQVGQRLEEERLEKFAEKACEEQRAYSGDRP